MNMCMAGNKLCLAECLPLFLMHCFTDRNLTQDVLIFRVRGSYLGFGTL